MRLILSLVLMASFACISFAQTSVWVDGYTRTDGTYVPGHYRTSPDNTTVNNYWDKDYPKVKPKTYDYDDNSSSSSGSGSVWVNGYYRKDGTYVQGHYRRR